MCDDSSNKNNLSRRNFLGSALTIGAGTFLLDPVRAMSEGIADAMILRAHAEATGTEMSRNYVNIQMAGAPIRYQFDQWLKIDAKETLGMVASTGKLNPMICNSFDVDSKGVVTPVLRHFTYKNVLAPHLFSQTVFNSKGQARPLTELLDNMLIVRGFGTGLDGHQFNMLSQQSPIGGVSTISGLAADNSKSTFDSVQWPDRGVNGTFISGYGKAQSKITTTTPLTTLMAGFGAPTNKKSRNLKSQFKEAMDLAQARLKAYSRADNSGSPILAKSLTNATEMMAKGIGSIDAYWPAAVARYKAAIEKSVQTSNLPFISDKALVSDETPTWVMGAGDIIRLSKTYDFRDVIKKATVRNLAESLALAEYLLKEGLATSIDVRCDQLQNLDVVSITTAGTTVRALRDLPHDMHATAVNPMILLMTAFYRGLSAGILELKDQLGPQLWQNTVVQVQGDFGRSAQSSGRGSDHGFTQMVTSAFTGAFINGPIVVGNIHKTGASAAYDGTQGLAAAIDGYTQKGAPTPVMAAATVTALLGVNHNPFQNTAAPLIKLTGNTLTAVAKPKLVG